MQAMRDQIAKALHLKIDLNELFGASMMDAGNQMLAAAPPVVAMTAKSPSPKPAEGVLRTSQEEPAVEPPSGGANRMRQGARAEAGKARGSGDDEEDDYFDMRIEGDHVALLTLSADEVKARKARGETMIPRKRKVSFDFVDDAEVHASIRESAAKGLPVSCEEGVAFCGKVRHTMYWERLQPDVSWLASPGGEVGHVCSCRFQDCVSRRLGVHERADGRDRSEQVHHSRKAQGDLQGAHFTHPPTGSG